MERAATKTREELLGPRAIVREQKRIRCITTYNRNNPDIREIINKHEPMLLNTKKGSITAGDLQVVYRRASNLRDSLVSSKLNSKMLKPITEPCGKPCLTCKIMNTSTVATDERSKISYKIRGNFNCQSLNTIYRLTCKPCQLYYIGESSTTLNTRMRNHESTIRRKTASTPVAIHFESHDLPEYHIEALDMEPDKNKRLRLEEAWMHLLNTINPNGLNLKL